MWPRLAGIGAASVVSGYTIVLYYNVVIAWAIFYFFSAIFNGTVPWSEENYDGNYEYQEDGTEVEYLNCPGYHVANE
jgi:SNF family Na+-dependent transporter